MTLITVQSRIHFASDVLEEALRAELEECRHRRVAVLFDARHQQDQLIERVQLSLPDSISHEVLLVGADQTSEETSEIVLGHDAVGRFDAIIACGTSRVIAHARKCRQTVAFSRYSGLSAQDRRTQWPRMFLPDFFAIPGVDGLPDPSMSGSFGGVQKTTPPNVIICDPSLLAESTESDIASAFAVTLGRCLATFAGANFNPLADGMAVEGLRRLSMIQPLLPDQKLTQSRGRDLMAASLNGSISQQKGPGLVQAIANALNALTNNEVDRGSLHRILLPRLLQDLRLISGNDEALVMRVLDVGSETPLGESVERIFKPLPLNRHLSDLGYKLADIHRAVQNVENRIHLTAPVVEQLRTIVEDVY